MTARRLLEASVDLVPWAMRDRIRRIPILRSLQRRLVDRFLSGRSFAHTITAGPARGVRFPITMPGDKLIWTGTWEKELAEAVRGSVRQGDVCFDVGSYRGFFAGVMAAAGASIVHCFEPSPSNVASLEELRVLNPGLSLEVHALAVGAHDGNVEFSLMPEATMGKLITSSFQPDAARRGSLTVQVARLDTMVESGALPVPDVVKIDVEGAELDVLCGAQLLLETSKPRVFLEAHSPELAIACSSKLSSLGYSVSVLETGGDAASAAAMETCHLVARRV